MKSDEDIIRLVKKQKGTSATKLSKQQQNFRDCQAFYNGDFMSYTDRMQMADGKGVRKSVLVQFNRVKPYVNSVSGFMIQQRRVAKYEARHTNSVAQEFYTQYSNACAEYVREEANADQHESQQDKDMLIGGVGLIETAMSYGEGHSTTNPNGEIIMGRLDPRAAYWDPSARSTNLLDSRWMGYTKVYSLDEALDLFDDSVPEDFESDRREDEGGNKVYYKRGGTYNKIQELYDVENEEEELIKVHFHQWYEIETFYRAKNPVFAIQDPGMKQFADQRLQEIAADQNIKIEQEDMDDLYRLDPRAHIINCDKETKAELEEFFEGLIEFDDFKRKVFYSCVWSNNKVFCKYRSVSQQGYSIKAKTGDYDDSSKMWVGMVNSLRDPALYYNKALTEMLWVIASQAKGGVMYEESAIDSITEFEAGYAKTDGSVKVNDGAISGGKIKSKKEQYTSTGIEQILQESANALPEVSGLDKNFLGSSENKQETAALHRQRVRQVTTALAGYFDSISLYQKEHAKLLLTLMKILAENNDGSLFKAIDQENGALVWMQLGRDNFVDEYDVTITEAESSPTEQAETSDALFKLAESLMQLNPQASMKILAIAIKNRTEIDFSDRKQIMEAILPQGPDIDPAYVQKLQKQIQALMDQGRQAEIAEIVSKSHLNMMKGEEIIANIKHKKASSKREIAVADQTNVETQIIKQTPPDKRPQLEVNA